MRASAHLTNETLLLHLAAELAQSLLELLRILDDYLQTSITPFSQILLVGVVARCPTAVKRPPAGLSASKDTPSPRSPLGVR